jgi:hypothetical protein
MKKKIFGFVCAAVIAGTAAIAVPAFAEDAKPAGLKVDDVKNALGMSIYLQAGITYNDKASDGEVNDLRAFDAKANSFMLDLMELQFAKDPTDKTLGFKVKLSAGETAKKIHALGLGSQPTGTIGVNPNPESTDITEAYVSYLAPVGKGLRIDFGKMATFIGGEVIEAIDNPNYSRSFLFNYAEPLTHTGVKASYTFSDQANAALFVVNGWDDASDNNTSKSVGVSVNLVPNDKISGYINYLTGPEKANNNHDNRSLLDLVATITPIKPLTISLNYDYGTEETAGASTAKWSGISAIAKYAFSDSYSLAVRGESFDDTDGTRTGLKQKLTEVTLTPEIKTASGLIVRPEYRHDTSDKESFDNLTKKSQDTIALGVMYRW